MPPRRSTRSGRRRGCRASDSTVWASDIVTKFKKEEGVQIVNAVFLTDGASNGMVFNDIRSGSYTRDEYTSKHRVLKDSKTNKDYSLETMGATEACITILKERTGVKVINFYMGNGAYLPETLTKGWDLHIAIDPRSFNTFIPDIQGYNEDQIKDSFKNKQNLLAHMKPILSEFIDLIA